MSLFEVSSMLLTPLTPPIDLYPCYWQACSSSDVILNCAWFHIFQGPLVYVNYGRQEDFQLISAKLNITGCICIARYGKGFRGKKATYAAEYGCSGLILYSDPYDYALNGTDRFYPNSWWLPGSGVQSGTLKDAYFGNGDPLTPVYPAVKGSYRIDPKNVKLPRIPVYPIGFEDAVNLLAGMTGEVVPTSWVGKLNVAYRFGPGFFSPELRVKMEVQTISKMATIQNVFGFIKGHEEPDRYVLLGNHHDTWAYGAIDPHSATAAMLELSRAMAELVRVGWRPRRTLVFCSWSAEEYEPIGSREWVENFVHILGNRAVAYFSTSTWQFWGTTRWKSTRCRCCRGS